MKQIKWFSHSKIWKLKQKHSKQDYVDKFDLCKYQEASTRSNSLAHSLRIYFKENKDYWYVCVCVCVSICFFHVCMPLPIRKCHPWLCVTVPILFPMWASIKHHMFLGVTRHSNSMPKEGADHSNIIILRFRSVHDNFQDKEAIFRPAVNIFLIPYWQYTHVLYVRALIWK